MAHRLLYQPGDTFDPAYRKDRWSFTPTRNGLAKSVHGGEILGHSSGNPINRTIAYGSP